MECINQSCLGIRWLRFGHHSIDDMVQALSANSIAKLVLEDDVAGLWLVLDSLWVPPAAVGFVATFSECNNKYMDFDRSRWQYDGPSMVYALGFLDGSGIQRRSFLVAVGKCPEARRRCLGDTLDDLVN